LVKLSDDASQGAWILLHLTAKPAAHAREGHVLLLGSLLEELGELLPLLRREPGECLLGGALVDVVRDLVGHRLVPIHDLLPAVAVRWLALLVTLHEVLVLLALSAAKEILKNVLHDSSSYLTDLKGSLSC
jgi:hypothetical protein